jgi:hypothetical protein
MPKGARCEHRDVSIMWVFLMVSQSRTEYDWAMKEGMGRMRLLWPSALPDGG